VVTDRLERWLGHDSAVGELAPLLAGSERASVAATSSVRPLEVSVVIPTFNRPSMLTRALESVAVQRPRPPAEVIVVDDGSTQDLGPVVERFEVTLIRHPQNRGLSAARNTGVAAASWPWIALLDSDDEWLPHHLATLWPLRDEHLLVAASALRCASDGTEDRVQGPLRDGPLLLESPATLLYPDNFICPSAVMARREAIEAAGGFEAREGVVEDLYLWCRLLDAGTGVASPTVSLRYHIHAQQMTHDFERMHSAHLMVAESFAGREWWSRKLVERRRGTAAWSRLREYSARGERLSALRAGAEVLGRPQRVIGVIGTLVYRLLRRRRSSRVQRDGKPSIVVLRTGSEAEQRVADALRPLLASDWRSLSIFRAFARLLRRPCAIAVVESLPQALLVRLVGVRPVRAAAAGELFTAKRLGATVASSGSDAAV
jgi:glycosyltransferase involved in cell wall biosynthesis